MRTGVVPTFPVASSSTKSRPALAFAAGRATACKSFFVVAYPRIRQLVQLVRLEYETALALGESLPLLV